MTIHATMPNCLSWRVAVALGALAAVVLGGTPAALGAETLTVSFTTSTTLSPEFAPRNVVAAWIEKSDGTFVKTIGRRAGERYYDLVNWTGKAGYDTDAVTGATRSNHTGTLQVTWDMTNKAGDSMPDGTYRIRLELADRDRPSASSNNLGTFTFVKNGTASSQSTSGGRFSNVSIVYSGRPVAYTLNVTAGAGGQIVQPAMLPMGCQQGQLVTIQASPSAGYTFAGWTGSANVASSSESSTTVTMLANTTLTANFTDLDEQFTVSTTSRSVTEGSSAAITVALSKQPTATVTASLSRTSGDADISTVTTALQFTTSTWSTPQTVTFSAAEDADAANGVAIFRVADAAAQLTPVDLTLTEADDDHTLSVAVSPADAGSASPAGATVREGDPAAVVPLVASPAEGWEFVAWTGDVQNVAATGASETTVTMASDAAITASFQRISCTLTVSADPGGQIDAPSEPTTVHDYGTVVTLTATPDAYRNFDRWLCSPGQVADPAAAETTITLTADTSVVATFVDADDDEDQLPDWWEAQHFTDIAAYDGTGNPDFDLLNNAEEYALGSDPTKTTLTVTAGWNLVSVPRSPADGVTVVEQLSGLSYGAVWGWDRATMRYYDVVHAAAGDNVLKPLNGYWLFALADGWTDLSDTDVPAGDLTLAAGWNLIGPLAGGTISGGEGSALTFIGWSGTGYTAAAELLSTMGFWVFCDTPVTVTLP